jgi:hypothetical protein
VRSVRLALWWGCLLGPALSFAQSIFIESPAEGDTITSPQVTLQISVSRDFVPGRDGKILIRVDGVRVRETESLRVTLTLAPGTHQIEAVLVDPQGRPISTSLPAQVKVTIDDRGP